MKNDQAVIVRKAVHAIGVGLLEQALEHEGRKGCGPILCCDPVPLEPPYQTFDSSHVLSFAAGTAHKEEEVIPLLDRISYITLDVYAGEEDILSIAWMETLLRCLAVLAGPFSFELFGCDGQVWVRFAVPRREIAGFSAALLGHFPAIRLRPVEIPFPASTPTGVEELIPIGPYHRGLSLLGSEGASPLGLAVQVLSQFRGEECGVFQVLLTPTRADHDWHYNIQNMVEAEVRAARLAQLGGLSSRFSYDLVLPPLLDEAVREKVQVDVAFFAAVARYACWDTAPERTSAFCQGMRVATGMLRFGNRSWRVLDHSRLMGVLGTVGLARMVADRLSHRPGLPLTSRELASLVHIPNARTLSMLACLAQRRGLPWLPLAGSESGAARLGVNEYAGTVCAVEIPLHLRLRHTYVLGATGTGKSKLVERLAVEDAHAGMGMCLVDPHGDLCLDVLSHLPEHRLEDLVYVSFGEPGLVPRWNPFTSGVAPGKLADDMARAFLAQAGSSGARMEHNFRMLAYVVAELGGTLEDFAELAARSERGKELARLGLERIRNAQVQRFLSTELPKYAASDLGSVVNKLSRLLLDDQLGAMFRQPENTLDPRRWMDDGRIVLVNLAAGMIGADHARFVGSLLVSLLYRAATSRADLPQENRRPFVLYIDEFQNLQAATLSELLGEGRKYGVAAVLAHQERGQLGSELAQSIGNCATKVVFRPSEDDLPYTTRVLGSAVEVNDLRRLRVGEAFLSCEGRTASLKTELCPHPVIRDPRGLLERFTREHYAGTDQAVPVRTRRRRVYDTFGRV